MADRSPVRPRSLTLFALALLVAACGSTPATNTPPPPAAAPGASPAANAPAAPANAPSGGSLVFLSTQFKPIEEAERMRTTILSGFPGQVEFLPEDGGPFNDRVRAEAQAGNVTVSVIGGLHGDFAPFARDGLLEDVTPLLETLKAQGYPEDFIELSKLGTEKHHYVPWMQGTYLLAANKQALQYLPSGADANKLTYAQLREWAAAVNQAKGQKLLGFPGGPKGLMHRFFQGYLYPSYTGSSGVAGFKSTEAAQMWTEFKALWAEANPQSTSYEFMQEPLLSGEVWIAWDNAARLINAVKEKPDDFVLLPAPAGPKGRGYMPVLAGLGIPKGAPNRAGAEQLITYLAQPQQQLATLRENAFFPTTNVAIPQDLPPGIRLQADAVKLQANAPDALVSLLPVGLGAKGGEFNKVYLDTFTQIVLNNQPVTDVLNAQAAILQKVITDANAPCWAPDPPSTGPCQVK